MSFTIFILFINFIYSQYLLSIFRYVDDMPVLASVLHTLGKGYGRETLVALAPYKISI